MRDSVPHTVITFLQSQGSREGTPRRTARQGGRQAGSLAQYTSQPDTPHTHTHTHTHTHIHTVEKETPQTPHSFTLSVNITLQTCTVYQCHQEHQKRNITFPIIAICHTISASVAAESNTSHKNIFKYTIQSVD